MSIVDIRQGLAGDKKHKGGSSPAVVEPARGDLRWTAEGLTDDAKT
jgi:hypothetical protein